MAEAMRIGVLVPNLFVRVSVDAAVRAVGARPVALSNVDQALGSGCGVVIADLDNLGGDPASAIGAMVRSGKVVLAFGPHVQADRLVDARAAGAVALPRSVFLKRLPELLAAARKTAG